MSEFVEGTVTEAGDVPACPECDQPVTGSRLLPYTAGGSGPFKDHPVVALVPCGHRQTLPW